MCFESRDTFEEGRQSPDNDAFVWRFAGVEAFVDGEKRSVGNTKFVFRAADSW
jgi:hypothetical protein